MRALLRARVFVFIAWCDPSKHVFVSPVCSEMDIPKAVMDWAGTDDTEKERQLSLLGTHVRFEMMTEETVFFVLEKQYPSSCVLKQSMPIGHFRFVMSLRENSLTHFRFFYDMDYCEQTARELNIPCHTLPSVLSVLDSQGLIVFREQRTVAITNVNYLMKFM